MVAIHKPAHDVILKPVVSADVENGILAIKGAIPGPKGGIVLVRSAVKGA